MQWSYDLIAQKDRQVQFGNVIIIGGAPNIVGTLCFRIDQFGSNVELEQVQLAPYSHMVPCFSFGAFNDVLPAFADRTDQIPVLVVGQTGLDTKSRAA